MTLTRLPQAVRNSAAAKSAPESSSHGVKITITFFESSLGKIRFKSLGSKEGIRKDLAGPMSLNLLSQFKSPHYRTIELSVDRDLDKPCLSSIEEILTQTQFTNLENVEVYDAFSDMHLGNSRTMPSLYARGILRHGGPFLELFEILRRDAELRAQPRRLGIHI